MWKIYGLNAFQLVWERFIDFKPQTIDNYTIAKSGISLADR